MNVLFGREEQSYICNIQDCHFWGEGGITSVVVPGSP